MNQKRLDQLERTYQLFGQLAREFISSICIFCLSDGFMRSSETVPDCLHKVQFPLFSKQFRPNRQHNNQIDRIHAE